MIKLFHLDNNSNGCRLWHPLLLFFRHICKPSLTRPKMLRINKKIPSRKRWDFSSQKFTKFTKFTHFRVGMALRGVPLALRAFQRLKPVPLSCAIRCIQEKRPPAISDSSFVLRSASCAPLSKPPYSVGCPSEALSSHLHG